jgi:AraC-like DNA-binding protein
MDMLTAPVTKPQYAEEIQLELRRVCGAFDLQAGHPRNVINGSVSTRRTGPFDTAIVALERAAVVRDARCIRQDPGEHFFLIVQDAGTCRVSQGNEASVLSAGDMFLVDSARPSEFAYGQDTSCQISLHIPREEIAGRFGNACKGGLAISRSDPLWIAMQAVFVKMFAGAGPQSDLSEALFSLLGAYLSSARAAGSAGATGTLLSRALVMIDRFRADPGFGPRDLARRLNVSERTLQRNFQPLGETPGRRLLERRLDLAYARLTAGPSCRGESVTSIALDCGFNDLSYFHREFRRKYGATPGTVARRH